MLSLSLKAPLSSQRHGLVRAFRPLFARYHEALRIHGLSSDDGDKKHQQGGGGGEGQGVLEAAERAMATTARILCEVRPHLHPPPPLPL